MLAVKKVKINNDAELNDIFTKCSSYVKYVVGVANNAAWAACLDSMEQIRQHPYYRNSRCGGTTPAREFVRCFVEVKVNMRQIMLRHPAFTCGMPHFFSSASPIHPTNLTKRVPRHHGEEPPKNLKQSPCGKN